jgi:flagellar basal-body rod protein FlgF
MRVSANNLSNQATSGFRAIILSSSESQRNTEHQGKVSFSKSSPLYLDLKPGGFSEVEDPLALALSGTGFFVVETNDGVRYVRSAQFFKDSDGRVVDSNGHALLGEDGPIVFNGDEKNIEIGNDGTINTNQGILGKIKVVTFERPHTLKHAGGSLYKTDQAEQEAPMVRVQSGKLENSNVTAIIEITESMKALRQYEASQRLSDTDEKNQEAMIGASARNV